MHFTFTSFFAHRSSLSRPVQGGAAPLSKAGNQMWALPLSALTAGLRNMGLSQFRTKELLLLENELQVRAGAMAELAFLIGRLP